ncbi:response regulator [Cumulibacter manganitolerans]|uniref:response regulator n=1 Tax=Cumulibacter manganitolerans TaxID=1884992 RepID=UPI0012982182|nr:response regulator transcription factor [Cumulibacter manganitolerans]
MIRVLIADDHPIVRSGLRAVLAGDPDIEITGEVGLALDAIVQVQTARPPVDVVTMDLRFAEGISGAEATRRLRRLPRPPAVLVLTNYDNDVDILEAIEAGASGYLLKDAPPAALTEAVHAAAQGRVVLAPIVADRLKQRQSRPDVALTEREREVLALVAAGLSNREIGAQLHLSQPTIKSHLAHVYGKLGVSSRTAALARARELGMLR